MFIRPFHLPRREGELSLSRTINEQLGSEVTSLKKDNASLFRKLRFLDQGVAGRGGKASEAMNEVEARYAAEYERSMDPFGSSLSSSVDSWAGSERAAAVSSLFLPERCLLRCLEGVPTLFGSRLRRCIFFLYFALIHAAALGAAFGHHRGLLQNVVAYRNGSAVAPPIPI